MKASLIAFGCIFLGAAACTAPQGKKIAANGAGLAPVAAGPTEPATTAAMVSEGQKGQVVSVFKNGTLTVTLKSDQQDGYTWRLAEIPDPAVLKVVSEDTMPSATPEGRGQQKWVFEAVGSGDVPVKMWYGNTRVSPVEGNPTFDFVAAVSDQTEPAKKDKSKKAAKSPARTVSAN